MSAFENDLALWIDDQISCLPDAVNLAYLEYNISNDLEFSCSFLGYEIHFDCFPIPFIDDYNLQGIDEKQLFAFDKIEHYADDYRIKLE